MTLNVGICLSVGTASLLMMCMGVHMKTAFPNCIISRVGCLASRLELNEQAAS